MAKGNYTNAYATTKPVSQDMAGFITDQENQDFKYRKEAKEKEDAQEEAFQKKQENLAKYQGKFKPYDTGSATYNTAIATALEEAKSKALEYYKITADRTKSDAERMEAQANLNDLENYPSYLKNISDRFTEVNSAYAEAVKNGEAWADPEWEAKFQNQFKGMKVTMGDNNKPTMLFLDQNGDGVSDFMEYEDIAQLVPENLIKPKVNMFKMAETYAKGLKPRTDEEYDPNNPYKTTETKGVSFEELEAGAEQLMTPQALTSYKIEYGIKDRDLTDTELKDIKIKLIESMLPYTERGVKSKLDIKSKNADENDAANRASRERIAKMNEAGRNKRNASKKGDGKTNASVDELINYSVSVNQKGIPKNSLGYNPKGGAIIYQPTEDYTEEIDKFYLTPDNDVIITGTKIELGKDGKTKVRKPFSYNSSKQADEVGKRLSLITKSNSDETFDSISEFRNTLLERKNATLKKGEDNTEEEFNWEEQ
jgi:hypothetical protein